MKYPAELPYQVLSLSLMVISAAIITKPRFRRLSWPLFLCGQLALLGTAARSTPDFGWLALSALGFGLVFQLAFGSRAASAVARAARKD